MLTGDLKICALIPTFDNAGTIVDVVCRTHQFVKDIIVVVDGSTDDTLERLATLDFSLTIVSYSKNRGKGYALRQGFAKAKEMGFEYAVTLDADGQHYPENIPAMIESERLHPHSLVVGSRQLVQDNMPRRNTFANRFSNFWFTVQTGLSIPDTQTGMRIYPLDRLNHLGWLTNRYESELELLVFLAWAEVRVIPVPIDVYYPPKEERVSHFRPFYDFARISLLNILLCLLAVVYGYPRRYFLGCVFLTRFFAVSLTLSLLALPTLILHGIRWIRHSYGSIAHTLIHWLVHHVDGAPMSVKSPENECPEPSVMVIAPHTSILDALVAISLRPKLVILVKGWVPNNPFFGLIVRALDFCPVSDWSEETMIKLRAKVADGYSIVVFPEGTRTLDGKLLKFHNGAFYLADKLNIPIQPVLFYGLYHVLNKVEFKSYRNPFFVEYLPAVRSDNPAFGTTYRQRAKAFETYFEQLIQQNDDIHLNDII